MFAGASLESFIRMKCNIIKKSSAPLSFKFLIFFLILMKMKDMWHIKKNIMVKYKQHHTIINFLHLRTFNVITPIPVWLEADRKDRSKIVLEISLKFGNSH